LPKFNARLAKFDRQRPSPREARNKLLSFCGEEKKVECMMERVGLPEGRVWERERKVFFCTNFFGFLGKTVTNNTRISKFFTPSQSPSSSLHLTTTKSHQLHVELEPPKRLDSSKPSLD
jgi:hypothetical protein